jgi:hypothetical protein
MAGMASSACSTRDAVSCDCPRPSAGRGGVRRSDRLLHRRKLCRGTDPRRQLPRVVAIALAVTTVLYLGLAVATISVLGPRAATDVPLAGLLSHAVGAAGPDAAAVAAIVLTLGATNAYINGARPAGARRHAGRDQHGGPSGGGLPRGLRLQLHGRQPVRRHPEVMAAGAAQHDVIDRAVRARQPEAFGDLGRDAAVRARYEDLHGCYLPVRVAR